MEGAIVVCYPYVIGTAENSGNALSSNSKALSQPGPH